MGFELACVGLINTSTRHNGEYSYMKGPVAIYS